MAVASHFSRESLHGRESVIHYVCGDDHGLLPCPSDSISTSVMISTPNYPTIQTSTTTSNVNSSKATSQSSTSVRNSETGSFSSLTATPLSTMFKTNPPGESLITLQSGSETGLSHTGSPYPNKPTVLWSGKLSIAEIIGIAFGSLAFCLIILLLYIFTRKRMRIPQGGFRISMI